MDFRADLKNGVLLVDNNRSYEISCNVRTLGNGLRLSHEVIYSIPDGKPYMPTKFPSGKWNFTGVLWQKDVNGNKLFDYNTYGPCKLLTNAFQFVKVWGLDTEGDYLEETPEVVRDSCYWFHYSSSGSTLGCIRIRTDSDAIVLGKLVESALSRGEPCNIEVYCG